MCIRDRLEGELTWLADVLGEPRDREVMLDRLRGELAALPVEQALGPVSARFDAELYGGLLRARVAALTALRGERYHRARKAAKRTRYAAEACIRRTDRPPPSWPLGSPPSRMRSGSTR